MNDHRSKFGLRAAVFGALLAGISIPFLIGGIDSIKPLLEVSPYNLLFLLALIFLIWNLNLIRFWILLGIPVSLALYPQLLKTYLSLEFLSKTTPGGIGSPIASIFFLQNFSVKPHRCIAAFSAAIILDISVILFLAAPLMILPRMTENTILKLLSVVFIFILGLSFIALLFNRRTTHALILTMKSLNFSRKKIFFTARQAIKFKKSINEIAALPRHKICATVILSVLYWGAYLSTLYFCIMAVGGEIDFKYSAATQLASMAAGHALLTPSGAATAELTASTLLIPALSTGLTGAAVLLWRVQIVYIYIVIGGACFLSSLSALKGPTVINPKICGGHNDN